jgi:hypothetical protein
MFYNTTKLKKNVITHLKPCRVHKESGAHRSTPNHTSLQRNKKRTWSVSSKTNEKNQYLLSCVKPKIEDKKYQEIFQPFNNFNTNSQERKQIQINISTP